MIKLGGLLTIKAIDGRNGRFHIGRLVTELGEFTVKDTLLEQYDPGRYEGEFGVSRIYAYPYFANGGVKVEIRAKVETIALVGIESLAPEEQDAMSGLERDPLDEERSSPPTLNSEDTRPVIPVDDCPDAMLFGDLWPLQTEVKLDPTVDRAAFRTQRDRLKALGYRFQAIGQVWIK